MRALLAGLLAAWIVAAPAAADGGALVATPRFVPVAGPLVAGPERLAWVTRRDDAVLDLWASAPGRGLWRVQRFSAADGERLRSPRLLAPAGSVALSLRVTDRRGRLIRALHYSGAFGEPLVPGPRLVVRPAAADPWPGHAVAVTRGCASAEIRTFGEEGASAATSADASGCALRLRRPLRRHGDRLRFGVSCAGFRIDCFAAVVVRAGGRVIARGTARYNHATPPCAAASLRLTSRGRRLLRTATRVRMTARLADPGLAAAVTRTTTLQLPAARR